MKLALVAPAAIVMEAGRLAAGSLLDSVTANPAAGAAARSVIVRSRSCHP
ncbi:MAG: hypothetical protein WD690_07845 [Vicinamibacterales bacterium]